MMDFLLTVLAVIVANYIHGLIFILVKANKYEDVLAKKVAKEVRKSNETT